MNACNNRLDSENKELKTSKTDKERKRREAITLSLLIIKARSKKDEEIKTKEINIRSQTKWIKDAYKLLKCATKTYFANS